MFVIGLVVVVWFILSGFEILFSYKLVGCGRVGVYILKKLSKESLDLL